MPVPHLSRRHFLSVVGAGVGSVAFNLSLPGIATGATGAGIEVMSWVVIHPDNRVSVRIPQSEIGQGASTALAQVIADELDLDLALTDWEFYDPQSNHQRNNVYVHTATLASWGVTKLFTPMRTAGAQIRHMLLDAAAERLAVDASSLTITEHHVGVRESDRRLSFAQLATSLGDPPPPEAVTLKTAQQWRYIGQSVPRNDLRDKTTGAATFGIDVTMPGMVYAAVMQAPCFGGRLVSFDAAAISHLRGVIKVVRIDAGPSGYTVPPTLWDLIDWQMDDAVAVVADSWWNAQQALAQLPVVWDDGDNAEVDSELLNSRLAEALEQPGRVVRSEGDAAAAIDRAATVVEAEYHYPYLEHAAMEPMNCTAVVTEQSVEAWAPTQYGDEALRIAAYAAGVAIKDAKFHLTLAGGGFGRRLHNDYVSQAVQVAKHLKGTPVKLIWSREETTRRGYYPPVMAARFRAGFDDQQELIAWQSHVAQGRSVFQPYGMARMALVVPNVEVQYSTIDSPPGFGWMRGVGHAQNAWMNHGFMSELAASQGMDSLSYQRKLLDQQKIDPGRPDYDDAVARSKRFLRLLDAVEEKAPAPLNIRGWGRGVAVHDLSYAPGYPNSCIAMALDLILDGAGDITVERVTACVDCGLALNPRVVEAQIQSGVVFGVSNALMGKITLQKGRVQQSNFHDYPLLKLADAPEVDVHILPSDAHPKGIGEGPVPVVIGALVDAIYAAGGPRIRRLPVLDHDLSFRA